MLKVFPVDDLLIELAGEQRIFRQNGETVEQYIDGRWRRRKVTLTITVSPIQHYASKVLALLAKLIELEHECLLSDPNYQHNYHIYHDIETDQNVLREKITYLVRDELDRHRARAISPMRDNTDIPST